MILAIESSCDETAAALVDERGRAAVERGRLPGRAARPLRRGRARGGLAPPPGAVRARRRARRWTRPGVGFDRVDAVAVTEGPGLIGALLVGLATAKALAFARRLPLIPVGHLHGHVASLYLEPEPVAPPFLVLLASGGHTLLAEVDDHGPGMRVVGQTLDDAAGEAFDKGARLLGLGYPGGAALERLARDGDDRRPRVRRGHGRPRGSRPLLQRAQDRPAHRACWPPAPTTTGRADLAASYQRAIVRSLVSRTMRALEVTGRDTLAVVGGVAANGVLRAALEQECARARRAAGAGAARALLRQRRHDRVGRALLPGAALPRVPGPRRLRHRDERPGGALRRARLPPLRRRQGRARTPAAAARLRPASWSTSPATPSWRRATASRSRSCTWPAARRSSTASSRWSWRGGWLRRHNRPLPDGPCDKRTRVAKPLATLLVRCHKANHAQGGIVARRNV